MFTINEMPIDTPRYLEMFTALLLSAFFPLLTYSFHKFRLKRKSEELGMLLKRLDQILSEDAVANLKSSFSKEYSPSDYFIPVAFVTALTILGMILLLMPWMIYKMNGDQAYKSVLFSGSDFWHVARDKYPEIRKSVSVVAFALLGGLIQGARYTHRRFSTIDLIPGTFFTVGIRMIVSSVISLLLSFIFLNGPILTGNGVLVMAFLVGYFPDQGFYLLLEKSKIFWPSHARASKESSLDNIEGISELHKIRLEEVGIDNVQNLAFFNFVMLVIKTPFPIRTLLDWIAQAKLIVEFQGEYKQLQKAGIRNVLDFLDACESTGKDGNAQKVYSRISEITEINPLALEVNYINLKKDQSVLLLLHFRNNLESFKA